MKNIAIILTLLLPFTAICQTVDVVLENLGEIVPGRERIAVNYVPSEDLVEGKAIWGSQTITIGWKPETGMESSSLGTTAQIENFTNAISGFTFIPSFNLPGIAAYDLGEIGSTTDGNIYISVFFGGDDNTRFPMTAGSSNQIFTFDYVLPVTVLKENSSAQFRFAPGDIFVMEIQPAGTQLQVSSDIIIPEIGIDNVLGDVTNTQLLLPVDLVSFKAKKQDDFSALAWTTASEINNDYFDVERSADARNFVAIGKVQGHGTTNDVQDYDFLDRNPLSGKNYYRLKQVDYNGAFEYSNVELVDFSEGRDGIEVFPNPALDYITIAVDQKYDNIKVLNNLGQIVETITSTGMESNNLRVNVADYTPGIYFLEAKVGTEVVNKQFVKVN